MTDNNKAEIMGIAWRRHFYALQAVVGGFTHPINSISADAFKAVPETVCKARRALFRQTLKLH